MNNLNEGQIFWKNIERIRSAFLVEEREFSAILNISMPDYSRMKKNNLFIPYTSLFDLLKRYHYRLEDLMSLDFNASRIIDLSNDKNLLEERYSYATFSTFIPVLNLLNYLESTKGLEIKVEIIKRFHIPPNFLYSKKKTNIHLISDIVHYLKFNHNFGDNDFLGIGQNMANTIRNSELLTPLKGVTDLREIITIYINEISCHLDENYNYKVKELNKNFAIIDASFREKLLSEMRTSAFDISNEATCLTRMGVLSSITTLSPNGGFSRVKKVASIFNGSPSHQYLIDLTPFNLK